MTDLFIPIGRKSQRSARHLIRIRSIDSHESWWRPWRVYSLTLSPKTYSLQLLCTRMRKQSPTQRLDRFTRCYHHYAPQLVLGAKQIGLCRCTSVNSDSVILCTYCTVFSGQTRRFAHCMPKVCTLCLIIPERRLPSITYGDRRANGSFHSLALPSLRTLNILNPRSVFPLTPSPLN